MAAIYVYTLSSDQLERTSDKLYKLYKYALR